MQGKHSLCDGRVSHLARVAIGWVYLLHLQIFAAANSPGLPGPFLYSYILHLQKLFVKLYFCICRKTERLWSSQGSLLCLERGLALEGAFASEKEG